MIWLVFAIMTAAVALCLVWPLARHAEEPSGNAADLEFYKSQLAEVEGDVERGAVPSTEAAATRAEIARRLIAAANAPGRATGRVARGPRVLATLAVVAVVPLASLALYLRLGSPGQPDAPLAARENASNGFDLATVIPRIEAHLAVHPEDGRGFSLIAPLYMRLGRYDDAAKAYAGALRTLGESPDRRAAMGQALVMAADGVVTADARAAFDRALKDDPKLPQARFFQAVAAEQDGDKAHALALWQALDADTPADAPWKANVEARVAALTGQPVPQAARGVPDGTAPAGAPASAAGAAIAALPADQQRQMIHGMVDGLAARLAQDGRDCDGWLRLIRAYKVLGEAEKARAALNDARRGLDGDAASEARVDALGRELGLES